MTKTTTTKPTETPEAKIAEIEKGLVPLEKEAQKIVIKSVEDVTAASAFLAKVKSYANRINEIQAFFVDPYVEQRRVALDNKRKIEAMFAPKITPLNEITTKVKRAISDYTIAEEKKAQAEEARKQAIRDKANEKRAEEGKGEILTPVKTVERTAPTVKTAEGRTTTRKVWKFEVVDSTKVPRQYLDVNESKIRQAVRDGVREVEGVRIYEDVEVSVSAN